MGIIKIRHQGPSKDTNTLYCSLTLEDVFVEEETRTSAKDHCEELDDSKLSEHALVNDQICNIPYELYELPNLKEILSLETWNSHLTEEERFHLAAYLPDMDQETFGLTMFELLGDANLFFGSPLEILFLRLKGGFYSLQVCHYREKLKFLYEHRYYHSLRSYHERMGQKIVDMRKAWSNCKPNTSVEERVRMLNGTKKQKPVFLVDLNAFPTDEELSSKAEKKAKGVLKIKPLEMNKTSKQVGLLMHRESQELFRGPPKGVLKIKSKGYPTSLVERPMVISVLPDQSSNTVFDVQSTKLSPSSFGEFFDSQQTRVLCANSLGLYQSAPDNYQRKIMPVHTDVTKLAVSRNSTSVIDDYQILANYPDHSEHWHRNKNGEDVERSSVFPIIYKRKKSGNKLSAVQNLKQPSMVGGMEPAASTAADFHQMEKAKSIKIRVKGWTEFTS